MGACGVSIGVGVVWSGDSIVVGEVRSFHLCCCGDSV